MDSAFKVSPVDVAARKVLDMSSGDMVRVHQKIKEKGKIRLQVFEGLVLSRKHGAEAGATFTVRKIASGVGVERIFPLYSPMIDKIEITKRSKTRRSKLYHVRHKATKEVSREMRRLRAERPEEEVAEATPEEVKKQTEEAVKE